MHSRPRYDHLFPPRPGYRVQVTRVVRNSEAHLSYLCPLLQTCCFPSVGSLPSRASLGDMPARTPTTLGTAQLLAVQRGTARVARARCARGALFALEACNNNTSTVQAGTAFVHTHCTHLLSGLRFMLQSCGGMLRLFNLYNLCRCPVTLPPTVPDPARPAMLRQTLASQRRTQAPAPPMIRKLATAMHQLGHAKYARAHGLQQSAWLAGTAALGHLLPYIWQHTALHGPAFCPSSSPFSLVGHVQPGHQLQGAMQQLHHSH